MHRRKMRRDNVVGYIPDGTTAIANKLGNGGHSFDDSEYTLNFMDIQATR